MVNNVATAATATATAVTTLVLAALTFARNHTRGIHAHVTYGNASVAGRAFWRTTMLAQGASWPTTLQFVQGATLTLLGIGTHGHASYYVTGNRGAGTVVVPSTWFANGVAPATLGVVGVAFALPVVATGAHVTSAVIAAGNVAQAAIAGTAVATPATVAATAATVAATVVAKASKASKASKAHAAKVS